MQGETGCQKEKIMRVAKIHKGATLPTRKNPTDAGLDLYAWTPWGVIVIGSLEHATVSTKIVVEIPKGHIGWITNKSSKNYLIGGGIVDEGYRGELLVKVINTAGNPVVINHKDSIAQLLIIPVKILDVEETRLDRLLEEETDRMDDGGIARARDWEKGGKYFKDTLTITSEDIDIVYNEEDIPCFCGDCGEELQLVRPGKHQCVNCEENWTNDDDYDYTLDDFNFDSYRERNFFGN